MPGTWSISRDTLTGETRTWRGHLLGRSEYGTWLYLPVPDKNPAAKSVDAPTSASMQLIPPDGWWVATWSEDGAITVDLTTPADVDVMSIRYLDLGVRFRADASGMHGRVGEAGLGRALTAGLLTAEQVGAARTTGVEIDRQLTERVEPFGEIGWRWFSGIRRNALHVIGYDARWPTRFDAARDEMLPQLPPGSRVEHVGSTSVPGLAAKDCLDLAVIVPRQEQLEDVIDRLESLGYEARRDAFGDDLAHVFLRRLTDGRRTHHVHLYAEGHPDVVNVLAFRDLLRADPESRRRYEAVKLGLADANPYDRGGYAAGKSGVVDDLLRRALSRLPPAAE